MANTLRDTWAYKAHDHQRAVAMLYEDAQFYLRSGDVRSAADCQEAAARHHKEARTRLERLIGVDVIVEQR